jgi:hypothetical protein
MGSVEQLPLPGTAMDSKLNFQWRHPDLTSSSFPLSQ